MAPEVETVVADFERWVASKPTEDCETKLDAFMRDLARALRALWAPAYADEAACPRALRLQVAERVRRALAPLELAHAVLIACVQCNDAVPFAVPSFRCPRCSREAN